MEKINLSSISCRLPLGTQKRGLVTSGMSPWRATTHVELEGNGKHSDDDVGQGEVRDEEVRYRVHPPSPGSNKMKINPN